MACRGKLEPVVTAIHERLSNRDLRYLINEGDLEIQHALASILREVVSTEELHAKKYRAEDSKGDVFPWIESGHPDEAKPAAKNPSVIFYGLGLYVYCEDDRRYSLALRPAMLATIHEAGSPGQTSIAATDGRYRALLRTTRDVDWSRPTTPDYMAAKMNIIEATRHYLVDVLHGGDSPRWAETPERLILDSLVGIDEIRQALADEDETAFQTGVGDLLVQNHAVLMPEIDPLFATSLHLVAGQYTRATSDMDQGRFVTDLFGDAMEAETFICITGRMAAEIDRPTLIEPPADFGCSFYWGVTHMSWEDRSSNEDGFLVERSDGKEFHEVGYVGMNETYHEDTGLDTGRTYEYRVRAFNCAGRSDPSNTDIERTPEQGDITPPSAITDLSVDYIEGPTVFLVWTATGDDWNEGAAAVYDLRYSTRMITPQNWRDATRFEDEPQPVRSGLRQGVLIPDLPLLTRYYFALKARDASMNISLISNVLEVTTGSSGSIGEWKHGFGATPAGQGLNAGVSALTTYEGDLIVGGNFTAAGSVAVNYIARWDGSSWHSLGSGLNGYARCLQVYEGDLYAGGLFTQAGGTPARFLARWDGETWHPSEPEPDGGVRALHVHNGELFVGGSFQHVGEIEVRGIARWDGSTWHALGTGVNNQVLSFGTYEGDLVVGGDFGSAGGIPGTREIARWDGSSWAPFGSGMDEDYVAAIVVYNGDLVVGGRFAHAGGVEALNIARWDGNAWHPFGTGMDSFVRALTLFDEALVAGGGFNNVNGHPAYFIARWDGTTWKPLGRGMNSMVLTMLVHRGSLMVGGRFTRAGGIESQNIARWGR